MRYEFEYYIANENNTPGLDGTTKAVGEDYGFEPSNMEKVLEILVDKAKTDKSKLSIIRENMPRDPKAVDDIMRDIIEYYEREFAPDDIKSSKDVLLTRIRFFMNAKSGTGESGEANFGIMRGSDKTNTGEICIYVKGFPKDSISCPDYLSDTTGSSGSKDAVWFENYLRYVLAHEMFHVWHEYHYSKSMKEPIGTDHVKRILMEIFAEYFATAYMRDYFHRSDPQNENLKYNRIFDYYAMNLFGYGRKKLLKKYFTKEEIAEDEIKWSQNKEKPCLKTADKSDPERPVSADYAGGYVLSCAARVYYNGEQGRKNSAFDTAYNDMLNDESNKALSDLIRLNDQLQNASNTEGEKNNE